MNKYEFLSNKINFLFRKLFNLKNHPFYLDLNYVEQLNKEFDNYQKSKINKKTKYVKLIEDLKDIPFDNKSLIKEFDINLLKKLSIEMSKTNNFDVILNIINDLYYMDIPSNIKNIDKRLQHISNDKRINVLIVGAGPVGLFLACYLFNYYNTSFGLNNYPKVNILVIDNRISKDGFKKPYTRHRPFAFNSGFFSQIVPRIYSWDPKQSNGLFLNIYILEYILFTKAYYEYSIPFLFEDIKWESINDIIEKGKFDVMFDCTGGNLKPPIFKDLNSEWIEQFKKEIPKNKKKPELIINKKDNLVNLDTNNKEFPKDYYYGSIIVYKIKELNRLSVVNFAAGGVATPADAALLMKLGCDGVFVGSGIFGSSDPLKMGNSVVNAVTYYQEPKKLYNICLNSVQAMKGICTSTLKENDKYEFREAVNLV